jgi:hypothetical protein
VWSGLVKNLALFSKGPCIEQIEYEVTDTLFRRQHRRTKEPSRGARRSSVVEGFPNSGAFEVVLLGLPESLGELRQERAKTAEHATILWVRAQAEHLIEIVEITPFDQRQLELKQSVLRGIHVDGMHFARIVSQIIECIAPATRQDDDATLLVERE